MLEVVREELGARTHDALEAAIRHGMNLINPKEGRARSAHLRP